MEDRFTVWHGRCQERDHGSDISAYGVYDGHASPEISEYLAQHLHLAVLQEVAVQVELAGRGLLSLNYSQVLKSAFDRVDHQLQERASASGATLGQPSASVSPADDPGSTAVLALLLHQHRALVVANVGNSRALLCSSNKEDAGRGERGQLRPVPLSRPHELWQQDEKERILKTGGTVTGGSGGRVPRLEGDLELSRAFGDLRYRSKGLIAVPEVQGPRLLDMGDEFLILASDGLFEVMTPPEVCAHAHAVAAGRSHPALSAPRPHAIPLHGSTPPGGLEVPMWRQLWDVAQPLLAASYQALLSWGAWASRLVTLGVPQPAPALAPGLDGCCDCGQHHDTCVRQAAAAARRAHAWLRSTAPPAIVTSPSPIAEAVSWRLAQEAYNRGSMDNVAVVVVDLASLMGPAEGAQPGEPLALTATADPSLPTGSWSYTLASRPVLVSSCSGQHPPGDGHHDLCGWTLHGNDQGETATTPHPEATQELPEPESSPHSASAYILTRRLTTVPSKGSWHAHLHTSCCTPEAQQLALTLPLDLAVLASAWAGPFALALLSSFQAAGDAGYAFQAAAAPAPAALAAGSGAQGAGKAESSQSQLPPTPNTAAMAHYDAMREWTSVLDLLASVCLLPRAPTGSLADWAQALMNDTGVCRGTDGGAEAGAQAEEGAAGGAAGSGPAADQPPNDSSERPQPPSAPFPAAAGPGPGLHGPDNALGVGAPGRPTPTGPVLTPAAPPPLSTAQRLEPPVRRGRALMFNEDYMDADEALPAEDFAGGGEGRPHPGGGGHGVGAEGLGGPQGGVGAQVVADDAGEPAGGGGAIMALGRHMLLGENALYRLRQRRGQGHFGEVWQAVRYEEQRDAGTSTGGAPEPCDANVAKSQGPHEHAGGHQDQDSAAGGSEGQGQGQQGEGCRGHSRFVLKRLLTERGAGVKLSGLREAYFGQLLRRHQASVDAGVRDPGTTAGSAPQMEGLDHLVRFVESFQASSNRTTAEPPQPESEPAGEAGADNGDTADLWLVFYDEGKSLHDLMYEAVTPGGEPGAYEGAEAAGDGDQQQQQGPEGPEGSQRQQDKQQGGQQRDGQAGEEQGPPGFEILGPSRWWHAMRRSLKGPATIRTLMRQLLLALDALHTLNITHRDVKPENMLVRGATGGGEGPGCTGGAQGGGSCQHAKGNPGPKGDGGAAGMADDHMGEDQAGGWASGFGRRGEGASGAGDQASWQATAGPGDGGTSAGSSSRAFNGQPGEEAIYMRLIDLGSAIDKYCLQHLYGSEGPSAGQLTLEYAPPEALFGRYWEGSQSLKANAWAHDIWAAGVVWLELLLATPHVFQLPPHTRALIDLKLRMSERSEGDQQLLYLLRGMMEWCIYPPQVPNKLRGRKELVSWSCTDQAIMTLIKARDPTGVGIESSTAVSLLRRLLHWEPGLRPTARQALKHAFFTRSTTYDVTQCAAFGEEGWC